MVSSPTQRQLGVLDSGPMARVNIVQVPHKGQCSRQSLYRVSPGIAGILASSAKSGGTLRLRRRTEALRKGRRAVNPPA